MTRKLIWLLFAGVTAAAILPFLPALSADFVNWDDDKNFVTNLEYRGLSWGHLEWMFTTGHHGGYYPVSWMTFGLDYVVWGMNPMGYHLTNLILHGLNAGVLFLLLGSILRREAQVAPGLSLGIAALSALAFAVHPLRVESVAWITERRGLLATMFALFCAMLFVQAARAKTSGHERWLLAASAGAFALSLLSKAITITLPLALLLLDLSVLGSVRKRGTVRTLLRIAPHVVVALAVAFWSRGAQVAAGTARSWDEHVLEDRLAQAAFGTCFYLWKTVVPFGLGPLYPLQERLDRTEARFLLSTLFCVALTIFLVVRRRRWPKALAAWLAYVALLLPVSGLAQSGPQIAADRYSYVASLPLVLGLSGLLTLACRRWKPRRIFMTGGVLLATWATLAFLQSGVWKDSVSLWSRGVLVEPRSVEAHWYLGRALEQAGKPKDAVAHYRACTEFLPGYLPPWSDLAKVLLRLGKARDAHDALTLRMRQGALDVPAVHLLATAAFSLRRMDEARRWTDEVLRVSPTYAAAWFLSARLHQERNDIVAAREHAQRALTLNPSMQGLSAFVAALPAQ